MPTTYPVSAAGQPQVPKDGKLYWLAPGPDDDTFCHAFRRWDEKAGRYQDLLESPGMTPLKSKSQRIPAIPPRMDGTRLQEGVGYDPIEIT